MVKYRLIVTDLTNTWVSIYWLFIGLYLDLLVPHCTRKLAHIPQTTLRTNKIYSFDLSGPTLHERPVECLPMDKGQLLWKKQPTQCCINHAGTYYLVSSKYAWGNIAQENYSGNVGPENADDNFPGKICLVACFLTWCSITTQSWLFLFNVGSEVHFQNYRKSTKWP